MPDKPCGRVLQTENEKSVNNNTTVDPSKNGALPTGLYCSKICVLVLPIALFHTTDGSLLETVKQSISSIPDILHGIVSSKPLERRFLTHNSRPAYWMPWDNWHCQASTNGYYQRRTRQCSTGLSRDYLGDSNEVKHGCASAYEGAHWLEWVSWACVTINNKCYWTRYRQCTSIHYLDCPGSSHEELGCTSTSCTAHVNTTSGWTEWSSWKCNYDTGSCMVVSSRDCPPGNSCQGQAVETETCNNHLNICSLSNKEPHWTNWGPWRCKGPQGSCMMTRFRNCSTGVDLDCNGASYNLLPCDSAKCAVDGAWGHWGHWSGCSVTCGIGASSRTRHCSHPAPKNGGDECAGSRIQTHHCDKPACPVDGMWNTWQPWSSCSHTCGFGHKNRVRHCDNPLPRYGGHQCVGSGTEQSACLDKKCPIDGGWGTWLPWAVCSASCGTGTQLRIRACNHPMPEHGGKECHGDATQHQQCQKQCGVNGGWGTWLPWTSCSQSCGVGSQRRVRPCNHPKPQDGGEDCIGSAVENQTCNTQHCGSWSAWFYTPCSVTCGTGSRQGMRRCSTGNDNDCNGSGVVTDSCTEAPCPVDGQWGAWGAWGSCSNTCGTHSHRTRHRKCDNPAPTTTGHDCIGSGTLTTACHVTACPTWSSWFHGSCSVTCGDGSRLDMRRCSSGHESQCAGSATRTVKCHEAPCA